VLAVARDSRAATLLTLIAASSAVAAALTTPSVQVVPTEWRQLHSDAVREAVVRDLLLSAPGLDADTSLCVGIGLKDAGQAPFTEIDAPAPLRSLLSGGTRVVLPRSRCHVRRGQWDLVDPDGRPAVAASVGELHWISTHFVKTRGFWLRGAVSAVGYRYTVSLVGDHWHVDTATFEWIS
jgi:hypothetical protein